MLTTLTTTPVERLSLRPAVLARRETAVLEVVRAMRAADQGAVLVVDERRVLIGILTERDLVRASVETAGDGWLVDPAERWMRRDPDSVRATTSIARVILSMNAVRFRRLPVVDDEGRAVGIVSVRDVLAYVAESFPEEFANLPPDPDHEASRRWGG